MRKKNSKIKKAKRDFVDLVMNPILTPSRRKGIKTIMKRKNLSFDKAKKYQAVRIAENKNNLNKGELDDTVNLK